MPGPASFRELGSISRLIKGVWGGTTLAGITSWLRTTFQEKSETQDEPRWLNVES